ncbi:bifunctional DNA primase/polymerase [uncultured Albimonas sp.]|uniref:bifunctional DNA primase/polymerase n=1 Tax=uncultured Albimonas sp. TaxID=1331701 RepID=UPI0030EED9E4|tara:strand:+ start:259 stop:3333 length:3075 start_codon:yes stop_codon:yes gene_type:complete
MRAAASFPPPQDRDDPEAASGRPFGAGATSYGYAALALLDQGYEPLPIKPARKAPAPSRWTSVAIDEALAEAWTREFPDHGVGLRTGCLVGIDIDILDPDLAHAAEAIARRILGQTPLLRVGRWPKRLLVYRTEAPFRKIKVPGLEILSQGQQFVAFGIHPDTGQPYHWPEGDTPLDVAFEDLPLVTQAQCEVLAAEIPALSPEAHSAGPGRRSGAPGGGSRPVRDASGRVVDGRDGWLSSIAYHVVHDALGARRPLDPGALADEAFRRFSATADLSRGAKDGGRAYDAGDAHRKVSDKLRLLREGRLPPRDAEPVEADYAAPTLSVTEARDRLDQVLADACRRIGEWHEEDDKDEDEDEGACGDRAAAPQIGIRATVGLGKSVVARRHALALRRRLVDAGRPSRIVVLTPSHALAQETAERWTADGARTAVLHGYEAKDPATGEPMCRDLDAVRAALLAGQEVGPTACRRKNRRCAFVDVCAKQRNRQEVADAEVVVAAYDVLFTSFAIKTASIGLLMIDEGCWPRAREESRELFVETFGGENANAFRGRSRDAFERQAADLADLHDLRRRARSALARLAPGPARRSAFIEAGLDAEGCRVAASIERSRLRDPGLYPGMPPAARGPAIEIAKINARVRAAIRFWDALADLVEGGAETSGRLRIGAPDPETGLHAIVVSGVKPVHPNLRSIPVLHLDATLRPALARTILPHLSVVEIEADAPHMRLRLVAGSFGKGNLVPQVDLAPEERGRRARRLAECVDYVRWQARRAAPGRVLVITHKGIEAAFSGIRGVSTAHFNAIAGLDAFKDVRLLIVVGRPLPPTPSLQADAAAFFGTWPGDRYVHRRKGVLMRTGDVRSVAAVVSPDEEAEVLRAAICDDEVIQAIGRGRGVNRTANDPLEVHLLADLALPLVHDEIVPWELVKPDLFQRMLLAGVALDSPGDAALLHPAMFADEKQAQKAFERAGFKRQIPMKTPYREMSLKSAAYRRPGRGRGWARAWWLQDDPDPRARIEERLGLLAEWKKD